MAPGTGRARALRKRSTRAERKVWHWLRNRYLDGYKFRRQHPVANYVLDFYCAHLRLCIELDGGVHELKAGSDALRDGRLRRLGIHTLRLPNRLVLEQPDAAWDAITQAVVQTAVLAGSR